ncbi:MAG: 50S ribosomal protein L5 [Flavobacteriales bacterium]|jgi:large subunit ribosomal protein L5|nr:50S ribosomal protein L5 [Flavobacteriales bacterium]MBT5354028.1 50S ribosomal protein L5 [Flavobacteriales bacterium]MBT6699707.1 50S ribosomal protein L5 [Flavobacteriales bacterium]MBT6815332.1 50S ribosomal protein L5 [Flavobacteriales bacterium]MBT7620402.1 50S ribosomal protein L5 [Flavobacteriales bacterium]
MEYTPNLRTMYSGQITNNLKGNYKSVMQVPKLIKICLNQGLGSASSDKKQIEAAQQEMTIITGQKALITKATKDISNFKLRKGMPVGVMVTLRGDRMYEFLERFITSTLPRVRDFQGLEPKGFDGRGNFTMGIKEQIAFPEISIDKINKITGMDITFVTDSDSDSEALILLKEFGLPFKKDNSRKEERKEQLEKKALEERRELEEEAKKEMSGEDNEENNVKSEDVIEENSMNDQSTSTESEIEDNNQDLSEETDKSES